MSTNSIDEPDEAEEKKCTRGEKCILIHIGITGLILLVIIIIYVVHLILVKHEGLDAFRVSRRVLEPSNNAMEMRSQAPDHRSIGVVYISNPQRVVCNSIFLRERWSLAPAHCITMRSEPELAQYLPKWMIRYQDTQYTETDIKRGMVHSYFNKDDFDNNIGLFEHMDNILLENFNFPERVSFDLVKANEDFSIVGWNKVDNTFSNPVRILKSEKCSQFVSAIVDTPRKAELCVVPNHGDLKNTAAVHGAALVLNSEIVGFFSWGDRNGVVPQVGLAITPYRTWLENIMAMTI